MKRFIFIFSVFSVSLIFSACTKNAEIQVSQIKESSKDHEWYFFTTDGIEKTSLPQKSGISSLNPWTETLRVSDANNSSDGSGFMIVNRSGVLFFDANAQNTEPVLIQDYELFYNSTASTLIFDSGNPYITFSRSSFFNKEASLSKDSENINPERAFLVRISPQTKSFYPVLTYGDLQLSDGGEITGTFFDGKEFFSSIKKMENSKTHFSYIKFSANQSLQSFSPLTNPSKITVTDTSEQNYRLCNSPQDFSKAPHRLKSLLSAIPQNFYFSLVCKNSGGTSPRLYTNSFDGETLSTANAVLSDGWVCAVFSDGTTYFNGALDGRNILNSGKNLAFRLPKLPENYIYGPFCIVKNTLAVAWEETDFYKTGRSGFLLVNLGKVLYGDL